MSIVGLENEMRLAARQPRSTDTYMQHARELSVAPQLYKYAFTERQSDEVKWLLNTVRQPVHGGKQGQRYIGV